MHITSVTEADTGLIVHVETDQTINGCPVCGVVAVGHGRRQIRLHDIPCFGRPVRRAWAKRLWRCPDEHCPRKVFSEEHPLAGKRAILTSRAVRWAVDALEKYDTSVSALAHQLGVSWRALWKGVEAEATRRLGKPERLAGIDALGVDEHVWTHTGFPGTGMVTGIIDHTRDADGNVHARLLDLVPGRSGKAYGDWLKEQGPGFTNGIKVATLDPYPGYANAIRDELPEAITVVDAFHIVKLGTGMVDDVRRRVQQDTLGHRGRKDDPLYGIRRTLQQGIESLTEKQVARLERKLEAGDPNSEVTIAWHSYQKLRAVYHARPEKGRELVTEILASFPSCPIPEIAKLGRSLRAWKAAILAYFDTGGASNGPTEAANGVIETTRRVARGFRNFENYRIRNLLAAGGHRPYRKKSPNHA
ncbi:ISL3 family transposase [Pseudarthrobacter sp. MDT3-9]|uniref:ISL3 family transposase n=1 Tax=Pseudarthrobacter raffinosi TaxID=2953651 RepID=UPI00208F3232|nr:ISL3 family transposase [Pseudarthrobacter sp. MDT3-9]MCO4252586.1 ISL3 family transposase [Pseudarthrobacter sp. MDT3-9]